MTRHSLSSFAVAALSSRFALPVRRLVNETQILPPPSYRRRTSVLRVVRYPSRTLTRSSSELTADIASRYVGAPAHVIREDGCHVNSACYESRFTGYRNHYSIKCRVAGYQIVPLPNNALLMTYCTPVMAPLEALERSTYGNLSTGFDDAFCADNTVTGDHGGTEGDSSARRNRTNMKLTQYNYIAL